MVLPCVHNLFSAENQNPAFASHGLTYLFWANVVRRKWRYRLIMAIYQVVNHHGSAATQKPHTWSLKKVTLQTWQMHSLVKPEMVLFFHNWSDATWLITYNSYFGPQLFLPPTVAICRNSGVLRGLIPTLSTRVQSVASLSSHHPARSCQWPSLEPIDWRYLPYIRPIFQTYIRGYPHKIWPSIWYVYVPRCIGSRNSQKKVSDIADSNISTYLEPWPHVFWTSLPYVYIYNVNPGLITPKRLFNWEGTIKKYQIMTK